MNKEAFRKHIATNHIEPFVLKYRGSNTYNFYDRTVLAINLLDSLEGHDVQLEDNTIKILNVSAVKYPFTKTNHILTYTIDFEENNREDTVVIMVSLNRNNNFNYRLLPVKD